MQRIIMHLDMNSYFASVEQQANPLLRGRPVGVCAYLSKNGCVIAASIEAKQQGVKTAMRISDARSICPDIVLVENEPAKYRFVSEKVFTLLKEYSEKIEVYSIDEAFLDMTGYVKDFFEARKIAQEMKNRIQREIGDWLKCSVGLAETRWLAKFASHEQKPDGLTVIRNKDLDQVFKDRPLQHAWGIGERLDARLRLLGIGTLSDLKQYPMSRLRRQFGIYGYYLWSHLNGIEIAKIDSQSREVKSIGHSYCIPRQTSDSSYLRGILMKLCAKTGVRLREKHLCATRIHAGYSFVSGGGVWHSWKFASPIFDTRDIFNEASILITKKLLIDNVRMMAVSISGLVPNSGQLTLFDNHQLVKRQLVAAIDKVNSTFGSFVVVPGAMYDLQGVAVDRIGFRKSVVPLDPENPIEYVAE